MKERHSPFARMYASFDLFGRARQARGGDLVQLSSGANLVDSCPSVRRLLHWELDSGLTYRNYGRSAGPQGVTDILAEVESMQTANTYRPAVTITNGAAEGARLVIESLLSTGRLEPGNSTVVIGHCFPLYVHLSEEFGFTVCEVLEEHGERYLPDMAMVLREIEQRQAKAVFLIVPNNPIGECYGQADLDALVRCCQRERAVLLVDRVCLLPWDSYEVIGSSVAPLMQEGLAFVIDSFSKSESLAGLRTGFILSSAADRDRLIALTQARWLNPIVFSTVTLALCRLATIARTNDLTAAQSLLERVNLRASFSDCPAASGQPDLVAIFSDFFASYTEETALKSQVIRDNYTHLVEVLGNRTTRRIELQAGFNVAVSLPTMRPINESSDQRRIAFDHGVAVLTENCFRHSRRTTGSYFVRIGLTPNPSTFQRGLKAFCSHYGG